MTGDAMSVSWSARAKATAGLVAVGLGFVYAPVLLDLLRVWRTDAYAAHGLLVAPFSAWAAFGERDRLRGIPRDPRWEGWALLLGGLAVLAAGRAAGGIVLQAISVPVVVAGWVILALGVRWLRTLAFPVGFLVFLAPLPHPVVAALSLDLQEFAARFGAIVASSLGIPVYQDGVLILLPSMTLQIAEICNGLRFMTALIVLTVALAHTAQLGLARSVVLVAVAVLMAILANGTRVAVVVVGVHFYGREAASGLIHHSIGKVVWLLTLPPLGLVAWLLRRGRVGHEA
jgi:exosortase